MSMPFQIAEAEGRADPDLVAARSGSVLALLGHLGVLQFSGEDAESFLQGQLSCDVAAVGLRSSAYGAYCSPKGRMLANFLLWREEAGFQLALSRDLTASIHARISKFVLRAKVKVSDASDAIVLAGAAGPEADQALREAFPDLPKEPDQVSRRPDTGTVVRLKDGRYFLALSPPSASALRQRLANVLVPVGAHAWRWLDIRNGVPLVTTATQDRLVPQMANFELLGGVSFSKGCYTGQEVVARMQHLGKLNRTGRSGRLSLQRRSRRPGERDRRQRGKLARRGARPAGGSADREPRGLDRAPEVAQRARAPLPPPALRRRVTLSFYIYYRVPAQNAERARAVVRELQRELAGSAGISGRLLRRRDDETTWMEIYENVQDGARFEAELAKLVERRGLAALLVPGSSRKQEVFRSF